MVLASVTRRCWDQRFFLGGICLVAWRLNEEFEILSFDINFDHEYVNNNLSFEPKGYEVQNKSNVPITMTSSFKPMVF